jgi:hypothetical protein
MLDRDLTNSKSKTRARAAQLIQLTKGYRIMRDLDNKVMNVLRAKLAYEVLVFLPRNQLCEAVSRHPSSRLPLNSDSSRVYLLAKLRLDAISVTFDKAYSLRIVAPESFLV